jgi:transglutaminase-like putative cysteine protease
VPATIALTALTLAVAVGFGRLFSDGSFLGPVVLAALAGHGVAWWCRRNDLPTGMAAVATIGAVALVGAWTILGETTAYGVPLPLTLRRALDVLGGAREQFSTARAPAEALPGFVLATVLALGVSAFMADWAAFRLQATFEALIPAFTLFLFTSALGAPAHRLWATAAFVAGVLAFLVTHGLARSHRAGAWFGGRPAGGPGALLGAAALLGAVALVAGVIVGPRLPGPDAPIVKYKNRLPSGPSSRNTISPLVDIRGRIVDQRDVELFTVEADAPSYWRLTSLDTFDGTIWSSNSTYHDTRGNVRTDEILQPSLDTTELRQEFSISSLASIWLPAAFRPSRASGVDVSYARDSASLITPDDTTDGTRYTIVSKVPKMTPALLDAAPAAAPQEIIDKYLDLPSDISDRVRNEARRITAAATTPYQRALALQNHFKKNYRYDINAGAGHDERTLESFLFQSKSGYCEQFAGVYAVLARLVGLPSRVAVGFTPGVYDERDGMYHVKGGHGHAWAEVYLQGYGWVQFDPTPGRGDPQASAWTGLPAAQDDSLAQDVADAATTTVAPGTENADTPTTVPDLTPDDPAVPSTPEGNQGRPAILTVLLAVVAVVALWALIVPALHLRRRSRRRQRPGVAAKVLADWHDTVEVLEAAGVVRRPNETLTEYARRAVESAGLQPDPGQALRRLAGDASMAAYAGTDVPEELAVQSAADALLVRTAVFDQVPVSNRVAWWLDPRPLVETSRRA